MINLFNPVWLPRSSRDQAGNLSQYLIEGQLKHELRIQPSQRLIYM